jgi:glutamyl-tRNA reductase
MLSVVSYSFKNAPVELRERLALPAGEAARLLPELRMGCGLRELMVLSTCNRVEYYFVAEQRAGGFAALLQWMRTRYPEADPALDAGAVRLGGHEALVHLMRVACSLESMVVGEPQILGQLKDAYQLAVDAGTAGAVLTGLLPRVFRAAKRVRTETGIARYAVSVSYVAVELAGRIFDSLAEKTVMVVGAGEMAELALSHLMKAGMHRLLLANRTYANAVALAEQYGGAAVPYEQLGDRLAEADIVITSTGAKGYIITREMAREASRKRRGEPMFFIDIAVPRDVAPAVNDLPDVYCYDIDDLKAVADSNLQEREREAAHAQGIIEQDVQAYERWQQSLAVVPTVKALRQRFSETARRELEPALGRLTHLTAEDRAQVQRLVHGVVNKLLHAPSTRLKQLAEEQDSTLYAEALSALFELEAAADEDNVVRLPARPGSRQ